MLLVLEVVTTFSLEAAGYRFPGFRHWCHTGIGHFAFASVYYTVEVLTVLYFAGVETRAAFAKAFGLDVPLSSYIWFAVVVTLALRIVGHLLVTSGVARGATTTSLWGFAHAVGWERYFYLAPALMAPFAEEIYMRGFFYRAFRGSYSVLVSTALILGITAVTHWSQYHHSVLAALEISAITVLQCFLRERTGGLWDCIICHFVFNASGAMGSVLAH